jgi:hypothetical protein
MSGRKCPVLIETSRGRTSTKVSISSTAQPVDVSLALRESGWMAYRVRFDPEVPAWIAKVIDWTAPGPSLGFMGHQPISFIVKL